MGSGNVVHNLSRVDWDSDHGSPEAVAFNDFITGASQREKPKAFNNVATSTRLP